MSTIYQRKGWRTLKKKKHVWAPKLCSAPQSKGHVMRARILTPRKPNSAKRPVAKVILSEDQRVTAHIPGIGHNLRRFSSVLVRGGGARDLPGVGYTCVRGVYDFSGVKGRTHRRSIYGVRFFEAFPNEAKKRRRKFRKL